ncbi:glycosyltransferase family 2 protein [Chachezhania sediminis]|uniref:glycosyltransferase family 2 protein n=1 Tax=Chachezhania sediminis TaxID=2599291 RepID=UPI001E38BBE2|nr:glycosyltransferase family 2 protein [Chachezhania sediminis]
MTLPTIASLWIGGNLSYLEQLCLQSFVDHGHRTILYTYGREVGNAPAGVEVMDAEAIFPTDTIIRHRATGSPAFHADAFRYKMLELQNVVWVDADVLCIKPWDFDGQFIFGWETPGKQVCNAVLGLPRFSRTLKRLNDFCRNEYPIPPWAQNPERIRLEAARAVGAPVHVSELRWGVWGPSALTHFLRETLEIEYCKPQETFYPVDFKDRRDLLRPDDRIDRRLGDGTYGVHLWNRRLRQRLLEFENGVPKPASWLGRMLDRHGIDPQDAPIPEEPPHAEEAKPVAPTPQVAPKPKAAPAAEAAPKPRPLDAEGAARGQVYAQALPGVLARQAANPVAIDPTLPTVASLWIGGSLCFLEQLCLKSFLDFGHRTVLYTYGEVTGVPEGIEVRDANDVFPIENYIKHKDSGSPALHSDLFRYKMIELEDVIWIDADVLCMKPWRFPSKHVYGWEKPGKLVCGAVLGFPKGSRALAELSDFCRDEYPIPPWHSAAEIAELEALKAAGKPVHVTELKWGVWGPSAMTYFLEKTGEIAEALPQMAFYPISFKKRRQLLEPGDIIDRQLDDGCYAVHLWNRRIRRRIITDEHGVPHPDSFLGRALLRHGIDPVKALIPDVPPPSMQAAKAEDTPEPKADPKAAPKTAAKAVRAAGTAQAELPADQAGGTAHSTQIAGASVSVNLPTAAGDMPVMQLQQTAPFQRAIDSLEGRTGTLTDGLPPLDQPISHDNIVVLTSMKNEGPFILEWIAYHRAIGVKHFLVYTNDCTDNTNDILNRLDEMGIVTRVDNPWNKDSKNKPQHVALKDAMTRPVIQNADWVLTIDVDEFVNIHVGDGTFADLFRATNDPNVISFTWKFFGNGGVHGYEDRPVIEQFTRCAPEFIPKPRLGWGFKSMIHRSAPYTRIGVHRPMHIEDEEAVDRVRWVNGSGRKMPEMLLTNNGWRSTKRSLGYRLATLNHYVLRSAESFLVKRDRGRVNHTDQDQGIDYWARRNYATEADDRMHARLPMLNAALDALMADPALAALHRQAVDWHRAKIDSLRADEGYAELYRRITDVPYPDAIYLTKSEGEDDEDQAQDDGPGVAIPEPEAEGMTEAQREARLADLVAMIEAAQSGTPYVPVMPPVAAPTPVAAPVADPAPVALGQTVVVAADTPMAVPVSPAVTGAGFQPGMPQPPIFGDGAGAPRYSEARRHVAQNGGFFWEGPENALMFMPGSRKLVVTFDNLHVVRTEEQRWPWGHEFLSEGLGASVLGVMASQRNWFRHGFVHDAFDALRDQQFFSQFDEVLFYGASMGGFAALTYSRCAPGARVLAIAPQSTLDPTRMPDDTRWGWTQKLDWTDRYGDAADPGTLDHARDVVVISDPYFAPDSAQTERLAGPALRHLRMPFFGHQLPNAFVQMNILKPILKNMLDGTLDDAHFYRLMRARRDLPRYQHDLLMEAERRGHLRLALRVCDYTLARRNARNIRATRERILADLGMTAEG